jgi:2-hydroxychromene-2-carboxylate isomerase
MIAYTAWDSLQAIAQQYDADLVIGPEQGLGLTLRRDRSIQPEAMRRLDERFRTELAGLLAPAEGRVSEEPLA